jgi:ATP-dependent Clp protease, protease subunit
MKKAFVFSLLLIASFGGLALVFTKLIDSIEGDVELSKDLDLVQVEPPSAPKVAIAKKHIRLISLKSNQVLRLKGEVNANVDSLILDLNKMNKDKSVKKIFLLIDSPGGSVLDGAKFVSAIEASPKPVYTICTTICASMAAIIHQYGVKRLMTDRSALMFHDAAGGLQGPLPQMRSRLNFFDRLTTKMDAFIAKRAGVPLDSFLNDLHSEIWIDAEDSLSRHFTDDIVSVVVEGEEAAVPFMLPFPIDHSHVTVRSNF